MPSSEQDIATTYRDALRVAVENPLLYRQQEQQEAADTAHANDLAYWKQVYPQVTLHAEDNPDVDYRLLNRKWQAGWGPPPIVFLRVTPRKKELPKTHGWLQDLGIFTPIIAAIPFVGQVASIAISVANASDQKSKLSNFISKITTITTSEFEPQYFPQEFPVLLPLDEAQLAVDQPWVLPGLHKDFTRRILEAERAKAQAAVGRPASLTLSASLTPTVTTSTGQAPRGNIIADLLGVKSPGEQYATLTESYGSRLPTYFNLYGNKPAPTAEAAGADGAGQVPPWFWLALAGLGVSILLKGRKIELFPQRSRRTLRLTR